MASVNRELKLQKALDDANFRLHEFDNAVTFPLAGVIFPKDDAGEDAMLILMVRPPDGFKVEMGAKLLIVPEKKETDGGSK